LLANPPQAVVCFFQPPDSFLILPDLFILCGDLPLVIGGGFV
jgi:hypothetical protein